MEMQKTYNPKDFEDRIYADWEKSGYFRAEIDHDQGAVYHHDAAS